MVTKSLLIEGRYMANIWQEGASVPAHTITRGIPEGSVLIGCKFHRGARQEENRIELFFMCPVDDGNPVIYLESQS